MMLDRVDEPDELRDQGRDEREHLNGERNGRTGGPAHERRARADARRLRGFLQEHHLPGVAAHQNDVRRFGRLRARFHSREFSPVLLRMRFTSVRSQA